VLNVHVADDPGVSGRLRDFLQRSGRRGPTMDDSEIRDAAVLQAAGRVQAAPDEMVTVMQEFEARYGGLSYPLIVGNAMEYGLDGDLTLYPTVHGPAFAGILDGDWTWSLDVLADGRTALAPGAWPARIIDRSVDQRLEKHALLAAVRGWPHRAYEIFTKAGEPPEIRDALLPPPVPEATGPADRWWFDEVTAVQLTLHGWPPGHDHWMCRVFARAGHLLAGEDAIVRSAIHRGSARPAWWCELCARNRPGPDACDPAASRPSRPSGGSWTGP
jgi:hypothetical protein